MSNEWYYLHEKSMDTIKSVARDLLTLAAAFELVGNVKISDGLFAMAAELAEAAENARNARRGQLDKLYKSSQADVSMVLSALLNAGSDLGKKGIQ